MVLKKKYKTVIYIITVPNGTASLAYVVDL